MIMAKIFMQGGLLMWPLVFIVLILFMLFRPQGLLGKADIRKV